jgi:transcriptional regulator with GAF, ATPase, and Fis domain
MVFLTTPSNSSLKERPVQRGSYTRRSPKFSPGLDGWHVERGEGEGTEEERKRRRCGMSDRMPGNIEDMLRDVREALNMDVAFVSEFSEDQLVFRAVEGDAESFGWQEGTSFPIDESYCKRVLDGRIPRVVPDAQREDATKDLRVTSEADIGSYAAVPLVLSDGRLYGTLCCLSHEPDPWLRQHDLGLMERTARWLVEQLERHESL